MDGGIPGRKVVIVMNCRTMRPVVVMVLLFRVDLVTQQAPRFSNTVASTPAASSSPSLRFEMDGWLRFSDLVNQRELQCSRNAVARGRLRVLEAHRDEDGLGRLRLKGGYSGMGTTKEAEDRDGDGGKKRAMAFVGAKRAVKRALVGNHGVERQEDDSATDRGADGKLAMGRKSGVGRELLRPPEEELRVPDEVESIKEAVNRAHEDQTVYVRAGEHRWRGEIAVRRNRTLHATGELGARLWGQWGRRGLLARACEDFHCVVVQEGSQGSLAGLTLAHDTASSFDACVKVCGGPWMMEQCKVLSSHATAVRCVQAGDVLLRRCSAGGLEPAEEVSEQVFGRHLARYGVYAAENGTVTLQACVIEHTGRTGGVGVRFSGRSSGLLQGCMLRCNDVGVSVDSRAHVQVKGSTAQRNAWSAWHVGYKTRKCRLDLEDNTVIGREWFNKRRPSEPLPVYQTCCQGRGCHKCIHIFDTAAATAMLRERMRLLDPDAPPLEESLRGDAMEEEDDGNHTRHVITHWRNGSVMVTSQRFEDPDECLKPPPNISGPRVFFTWGLNKAGPPDETRMGIDGLSAVAKWWDRCAAEYI